MAVSRTSKVACQPAGQRCTRTGTTPTPGMSISPTTAPASSRVMGVLFATCTIFPAFAGLRHPNGVIRGNPAGGHDPGVDALTQVTLPSQGPQHPDILCQ